MTKRMQAVYRLLALVYFALIGWLVAALGVFAGAVFMVIDVILQLVTGGEGLSPDNLLGRLYDWPVQQLRYIYLGKGGFPLTP